MSQIYVFYFILYENDGAHNYSNVVRHKTVTDKKNMFISKRGPCLFFFHFLMLSAIAPRIFNFIGYCRTSKLRFSWLNQLTILATIGLSGHFITGDLDIIENEGLRYREHRSINWNDNFEILMDAMGHYARKWIKRELKDLD